MKQHAYIPAALILTGISAVITLLLLPSLPASIITRWAPDGTAVSEGPRYILLLTAGLPMLAIWLIARSPAIHPEGREFQKHRYAYGITMGFFLFFLIGIHWVIMLHNLGIQLPIPLLIKLLLGIALIITGLLLPNIPYGHSIGIRTPWSTEDRKNWEQTHRFAKLLFIIVGIIFLAMSPAGGRPSFWIGTASLILMVFALYYYSYKISQGDDH